MHTWVYVTCTVCMYVYICRRVHPSISKEKIEKINYEEHFWSLLELAPPPLSLSANKTKTLPVKMREERLKLVITASIFSDVFDVENLNN
jgi:hypothetical protein